MSDDDETFDYPPPNEAALTNVDAVKDAFARLNILPDDTEDHPAGGIVLFFTARDRAGCMVHPAVYVECFNDGTILALFEQTITRAEKVDTAALGRLAAKVKAIVGR